MADSNDSIYEFSGSGLKTSEKNLGKKKFAEYLSTYPHLNKLSNLQLLEELVFCECIQERYKEKVSKLGKKSTDSIEGTDAVPDYLQRQLKNNLEQIIELKERLGLFEEQKNLDIWEWFKDLMAKFKLWREQNQDCRKVTCPFCSEPFFLQMRTDRYKEMKFPMFQGKVLCNPVLHSLWKEGIISAEKYCEIMGTSNDYPQWLEENVFSKKSIVNPSEVPQEQSSEEPQAQDDSESY